MSLAERIDVYHEAIDGEAWLAWHLSGSEALSPADRSVIAALRDLCDFEPRNDFDRVLADGFEPVAWALAEHERMPEVQHA